MALEKLNFQPHERSSEMNIAETWLFVARESAPINPADGPQIASAAVAGPVLIAAPSIF